MKIQHLKIGDRFTLDNIIYRKIRTKRSVKNGTVNAQNIATKEKRFILDTVNIEPLTEGFLYRMTPIQCEYHPGMR